MAGRDAGSAKTGKLSHFQFYSLPRISSREYLPLARLGEI
jgi:hypothetical protein